MSIQVKLMIMSIQMKLSNIFRNFHRTSEHPEADLGDVHAAINAIMRVLENVIEVQNESHPSMAKMLAEYPCSLPSRGDSILHRVSMPMADYDRLKQLQHRVEELLEANNRYLNRARTAEANEIRNRSARQADMLKWAVDTFGGIDDRDPIALDERVRRYFEESAELFQACGLDLDSAVKILKRVFGRPPGEPEKELGQAQMTLSILAEVLGITAVDAEIHEFERVQSVPREEFRRRHRAKSEIGI